MKNNKGYEIKFNEYGVPYNREFDNYFDMAEFLNYIHPYKRVTNIELYINGELDDYIDYLG